MRPPVHRGPGRLAVVVVGAVVVAGAMSACTPHAAAPPASGTAPAGSIEVAGHDVPYAGPVPWSGAVADPRHPQALDVYADGDALGERLCGLPTERVTVRATGTSVTVLVAGYGKSVAGACGGVGHSPQYQRVRLAAPLGGRRLIDASDGEVHPLLDPATVPTLSAVPAGYRERPVTWDDASGEVTRSWKAPTGAQSSWIDLSRAPPGVIETRDGPPSPMNPDGPDGQRVASGVDVVGRPANVWDYRYNYGEIVTIRWTAAGGQEQEVTTSVPVGSHLGVDEALALARSTSTPGGV